MSITQLADLKDIHYFNLMIEALINSKTRLKLLLKFFLNPECTSYLRELAVEFGESTNSIRLELNKFEKADMLNSFSSGNRKLYRANTLHPLFSDIRNIIMKTTGIDHVIEGVVKKLGNPEKVYLTGDFANGTNGDIIDLAIIGDVDQNYLITLIQKAEKKIKKRIRYIVYPDASMLNRTDPCLLLWQNGG